jgi:succinyl-CoA synthetase alpha subunit
MSILVDQSTRLLVQGMGREGRFHAEQTIEYGTRFVGGVNPGRGGGAALGRPLFNSVAKAVTDTGANTTIIFVPGPAAADAILEAIDAGIGLVVCITDGIPIRDMLVVRRYMAGKNVSLLGPNCPGLISPGKAKVGIMPAHIHTPGRVGVLSRSGTLTYEAVSQLTARGIGQSTCVGIGGDPVGGLTFVQCLEKFQQDPETDAVVLIGEIGGTAEEDAAAYIAQHVTKPVVSFIAGQTAPPGRRMGHAGAIIAGGQGTAASKIAVMEHSGIKVVHSPASIGEAIAEVLKHTALKEKHGTDTCDYQTRCSATQPGGENSGTSRG